MGIFFILKLQYTSISLTKLFFNFVEILEYIPTLALLIQTKILLMQK